MSFQIDPDGDIDHTFYNPAFIAHAVSISFGITMVAALHFLCFLQKNKKEDVEK